MERNLIFQSQTFGKCPFFQKDYVTPETLSPHYSYFRSGIIQNFHFAPKTIKANSESKISLAHS